MEEEIESEARSGYSPYILFFCRTPRGKRYQTLFSLSQGRPHDTNIMHIQDSIYWPTPQGWILTIHRLDKQCYLLDPITLARRNLPWLNWAYGENSGFCFLSYLPTDPCCIVLCANLKEECLFFCQLGDEKWIRYKYDLDKNALTNIVTCNGKFYGLTVNDEFSEIICPPDPGINILETLDLDWPIAVEKITQYLVESCGELFLVSQYHKANHSSKTAHISIKKREASSGEWVTVDHIGGRAFLLGAGNSSASCLANKLGRIKGDCIYFFESDDYHLYCFDIVEGFISVHLPWPNISSGSTPFWIVPAL